MVVHFIASKSHTTHEIRFYRAIIACVQKLGHTIAYDWPEETYELIKHGQDTINVKTWQEIDKATADAISRADVIIAEATAKSFFAGMQVKAAIDQKKPILILTRDTSPLQISGLSTPAGFVKSVVYNLGRLESILAEFLQENTIEARDLRFNFYLDRPTYTYLRWMSSKTGKTKAQIVRSLIQKEMNKES